MMNGIATIAARWICESVGAVDDNSRARWAELVDYFLSGQWSEIDRDDAGSTRS
ncbi:hypothetical protein [Cellulosimicrobium cellulans]|uniref:hypothetical protein n=1 Tax=Cellulosimicrobium cellulans TaxID=1710 RepID=UPI001651B392|nr:hypothetical protein [Cellulosimicrobium cellulans]